MWPTLSVTSSTLFSPGFSTKHMIKKRPFVKVNSRWVLQKNVNVIDIEARICGDYVTFEYKGKVYGSYVFLC